MKFCITNGRVRVRVMANDSVSNIPRKDLLLDQVIMDDVKQGWNHVDLSNYSIPVPLEGQFLSF